LGEDGRGQRLGSTTPGHGPKIDLNNVGVAWVGIIIESKNQRGRNRSVRSDGAGRGPLLQKLTEKWGRVRIKWGKRWEATTWYKSLQSRGPGPGGKKQRSGSAKS